MRRFALLVCVIMAAAGSLVFTASSAAPDAAGSARRGTDDLVLLGEGRVRGWSVINVRRGVRERVLHGNPYFEAGFRRSPDGSRVALGCEWSDPGTYDEPQALCVARLDRQSPQVVILKPSGPNALPRPTGYSSVEWSPDGRQLAVVWGDSELWTVRADGTHPHRIIKTEASSHPFWAPDGSLIAYTLYREQRGDSAGIYVVSPTGSQPRRIAGRAHGTELSQPYWSPQGSLIAYLKDAPGTLKDGLYVMRPDGSRQRRLVKENMKFGMTAGVSWSADGHLIASTRPYPSSTAYVVDVRTGRLSPLARGGASFAPSGRDLLLATAGDGPSGLYDGRLTIIRADGKHALLDHQVNAAAWSRDGRKIAYMKQNGLWIGDVTTLKTRRVLKWNLPPNQEKGPLIWR